MSAEKPVAPKKSIVKIVVLLLGGLLVAGGSAGGAWFMAQRQAPADEAHAKKPPATKPVFLPLDAFTVNLQDARGERFAQIGVTLQLGDGSTEHEIKERLPAVRNEILLLLASKTIEDLLSAEGKQKLAREIRVRTALSIGLQVADDSHPETAKPTVTASARPAVENPVREVLFSQFLVQ